MNAFLNDEFWESMETHVALAPGESAGGLQQFLEKKFGEQAWCLFQTSGSEGLRKWVGLTKEKMLISARAVNAHYNISERDHWLLALPVHHVGGFGVFARSFVSGSQVTPLEGKWDAKAFAQRCGEVGATLASLVPTQVFDLVSAKLTAPKTMRAVLVGGGAMSSEVEQAALQLGWPVRRTYGMTETGSQVASQTKENEEMEVLPIWNVSTDEDEVLTVRGEALAKGYAVLEDGKWRWEEISAEEGLRTRDRVKISKEGARQFLRFVGREANTTKILGELVTLGPIQERIDTLRMKLGIHAGEAVICDVPDARKEATLVLVVSGMSDANAERLRKGLNETLRPFECVEEVRRVGRIPRSDLGKVLLKELRRQL